MLVARVDPHQEPALGTNGESGELGQAVEELQRVKIGTAAVRQEPNEHERPACTVGHSLGRFDLSPPRTDNVLSVRLVSEDRFADDSLDLPFFHGAPSPIGMDG